MSWAARSRRRPPASSCTRRGSSRDVGDGLAWVETRIRVLEHHLESPPPGAKLGPSRSVRSSPARPTRPVVRGSILTIARASVDLPEPGSPTRPRVSRGLTERSTPSTAHTHPTRRRRTPRLIGNHTRMSSASRSGSIWANAPEEARGVSDTEGSALRLPARGRVLAPDGREWWVVGRTSLDCEGASRSERTAAQCGVEVGRTSADGAQSGRPRPVESWYGPQESQRVRM